MLENNPIEKENGATEDAFKRKIEDNIATNGHQIFAEEPAKKKKMVEHKCGECDFKCYNEAELKTHQNTSHGVKKKMKVCENCAFTCNNVWEVSRVEQLEIRVLNLEQNLKIGIKRSDDILTITKFWRE